MVTTIITILENDMMNTKCNITVSYNSILIYNYIQWLLFSFLVFKGQVIHLYLVSAFRPIWQFENKGKEVQNTRHWDK